MKILVDTNVILDVLCKREEFYENSLAIWRNCEADKIDGYISVLSIPNIVYILRKELTPLKIKEIIDKILLIFNVVELKGNDLSYAANMLSSDFEDALQMSAAKRINADYIVTRNIRDFKESSISALKPSELLERI